MGLTSRVSALPLEGTRVLDFSRVLAGPYCAMVLGDLGADVIKVEQPPRGDDSRRWGPPWAGSESAYFLGLNRNKRSITVDVSQPGGRDVFLGLVGKSDVLIDNMRPGSLERLGLSDEELSASNPALVHASISAYGRTGPRKDEPGYDFVIQAMGGLMSITGEDGSGPVKVGVAIVDVMAGLYAATGILASLAARTKSGKGEHIHISLFDTQLATLVNAAQNYLVSGASPARHGNAHANIVPYQLFDASDRPIVIAAGSDRQWGRLCDVLGCPELAVDPRFSSNGGRVENRVALVDAIAPLIKVCDSSALLESLTKAGVPSGLVRSIPEAIADPHGQEMVIEVDHATAGPIRLIRSPLRLGEDALPVRLPPPNLGQHTTEVLMDVLGLNPDAVSQLRHSGAV